MVDKYILVNKHIDEILLSFGFIDKEIEKISEDRIALKTCFYENYLEILICFRCDWIINNFIVYGFGREKKKECSQLIVLKTECISFWTLLTKW